MTISKTDKNDIIVLVGYSDATKPPFRSNGNRVTGGRKPHI